MKEIWPVFMEFIILPIRAEKLSHSFKRYNCFLFKVHAVVWKNVKYTCAQAYFSSKNVIPFYHNAVFSGFPRYKSAKGSHCKPFNEDLL